MSFWEFGMLAEGWYDDNTEAKVEPPSEEEFDDQIRRLGE